MNIFDNFLDDLDSQERYFGSYSEPEDDDEDDEPQEYDH